MTAIRTRPVTPLDTAAITAIYADAVRDETATFEMEAPDEAAMAARIEAIVKAGHPYIVAELGGAVVGYAYASTFRARAAFDLTLEDSVYVAPHAQRLGAGRALLAGLIDEATIRGFRQMVAVIGDSSTKAASIALHSALGFRSMGSLEAVGRKHGQWLDIVFMQRALG
jgi:L-amino acid N-acyltransferase YncA